MSHPHWSNHYDEHQQAIYGVDLSQQGIGSKAFFDTIADNLPPVFSRQTASKVLGNLMSVKTFSNLDALGQGPPKLRLGSRVGYERESFIAWLKGRLK